MILLILILFSQMFWLIACSILLTIFYSTLILNYLIGWKRLPTLSFTDSEIYTKVSIIIPARNESENLPQILSDILSQNFPKKNVEIIVVDDHSTDDTFSLSKEILSAQSDIQFQILSLSDAGEIKNAYKKKAIEFGIYQSKNDLIITTDADCRMSQNWLRNLVLHYQITKSKMIVAPVKFNFDESFFQRFQSLDFIGLIGITAASVQQKFYNMCNGANLCYEKKAFFEVNGFKGNDNISSGDDMFLMHKIAERFQHQISFIKNFESCVSTHPQPDWKSFMNQRLRWTSKSVSYADKRITFILIFAYLFNFSILFNLFISVFFHQLFFIFLIQFLSKCVVEFFFLRSVTKFFNQENLMKIFLPAQFFHVIYVVLVGFLGQLVQFDWKNRQLKK
jgi:cellulose synthase/poly-beta-1,6-N-acetylglucosamine synthase-like glycosyltransferase